MPQVTWKFAHTEDGLAVARHNGKVARVFHTGSCYDFEVMMDRQYTYCQFTGGRYPVIADGQRPTHREACEAAEDVLQCKE